MTEQLTQEPVAQTEIDENSRAYWKEQAATLGLSYPNNMPTEKLRTLVQETIESRKALHATLPKVGNTPRVRLQAAEVTAMQDAALALVRFRLTVLDPSKQNATGMFVSACNENIAPVKKMIPFNVPVWHAERIIVEHLKNMKYTVMRNKYNASMKGTFDDPSAKRMLPCFLIEELSPLTEQERLDLMELQAQQGTGVQASDTD